MFISMAAVTSLANHVRVREVFFLLGVNKKEKRKAETNSRCPL